MSDIEMLISIFNWLKERTKTDKNDDVGRRKTKYEIETTFDKFKIIISTVFDASFRYT